ncbi:MAG: hypothetical protein HY671_01165 [Chloroflexi bacterium]|nr:hypothetical protein [Chloroflexota bacterium]
MALRQSVVGQLLPRGEHWHIWVAMDDQRLLGLICTSPRRSHQVWQVAHLLLAEENREITQSLLQQITTASCHHGIEKLFLRLPQDSPLTQAAYDSGFERYLVQHLYRRSEARHYYGDVYQGAHGIWRPRTRPDNWQIFQLYSATTPAVIRQAEGLAYSEWLQSRERIDGGQEQVWEREGQIHGWASARPWWDGVLLESMMPPGEEQAFASLVDSVAARGLPVYSFVSSYQTHILQVAQEEGFVPIAECSLFLKRLLVRVTQSYLMPMRA